MSQAIESFIEQIVRRVVTEQITNNSFTNTKRCSLVVANWKMNKDLQSIATFVDEFSERNQHENVVICPPSPYLYPLKALGKQKGSNFKIGGQDVHWAESGAHTGDVSADQLIDVGCEFVIIGHSERRLLGETDEQVHQKTVRVLEKQLTPIVCVGETKTERDQNQTNQVVTKQVRTALKSIDDISSVVIAYEPVWAIGTGDSASPEQAQDVHQIIRTLLIETFGDVGNTIPLLYGGSVKPANVNELSRMKDIDGVLVGGASLKAKDFAAITQAFL